MISFFNKALLQIATYGDVMTSKFKAGDTVYIIENGNKISECTVMKYSGGLYMIRFKEGNGAIKLRESRLYRTKEEAQHNTH